MKNPDRVNQENSHRLLNKYSLPCAFKLSHIKFDLNKLRDALNPFLSKFINIYDANKGLHEAHNELADLLKDHFFEVSLTEYKNSEGKDNTIREKIYNQNQSRSQKYRLMISQSKDLHILNEHDWNVPTESFKGSYFFDCIKSFKSQVIRARLTMLGPGKRVAPHIDYNVNHAVRIIVPIYTNKQCWNYFWRRGQKIKIHIPADGHPWFLNVGLKHSVENLGNSNRIVFMFSLSDTKDIQHLCKKISEIDILMSLSGMAEIPRL